jgi:hypothetical protein
MTSEHLVHESGLGEMNGDKWQRHVIVALWVLIAIVMVVAAGLFYEKGHGFFRSHASPDHATQVTPWPDGQP